MPSSDAAEADPNASTGQDQGATDDAGAAGATMPDDMSGSVAAGEMTPAQAKAMQEIMDALQGIPASIGDAGSDFSIRDLSVRNPDGSEMFRLGSGALEFSVTDVDQEKSGMRFAYSHTGLDADWNVFNSEDEEYEYSFDAEGNLVMPEEEPESSTPAEEEKLDPQTEQLVDALAPRELAIDIRLSDVPSKQLWNTFVSTFYSSASGGEMGMEMEMMGMMLPMMLAQAGSNVSVTGTRIVTNTASLTVEGDVKADPASMMGASGTLTVEITGLDEAIELVKGYVGPEGAAETAPLEMLRAFGERSEAEGKTVDRYVVTLEPNGALMVNGKDMNFLFGGPGAGPMPGDMPEEMPEDMPMDDPAAPAEAPEETQP
jgi:hypothetical protein